MTGTKVIKLKLDGDGAAGKLPRLRGSVVDEALVVFDTTEFNVVDEYRDALLGKTKELNADQKQLQEIVKRLEGREDVARYGTKAGILLTCLIENSSEREFEFRIQRQIDHVGYRLASDRKMTVKGNVGDFTGMEMKKGEVNINGNTTDHAGMGMEGGTINIRGDARDHTGGLMKGGTINVDGDAGADTGQGMTGGTVNVKGGSDARTGYEMEGGLITVGKDAGESTGRQMEGGRITVGGNTGILTGHSMRKGEIDVKGTVGHEAGEQMSGGTIKAGMKVLSISEKYEWGEIWQSGERLRPIER
ncbi:MAG: hypothetical protein V1921_06680 [Candidatus Altiarchaeota archaeon]